MSKDSEVRGTNDAAQLSKLSCVELGYFRDDFLRYFVKSPSRRSPLINRGYFSRHAALEELLSSYLSLFGPNDQCQILSVGAGFDTTWFNLKAQHKAPSRYFEVDFQEVVTQKALIIASTSALQDLVGPEEKLSGDLKEGLLISSEYCLLSADLRDLNALQKRLEEVNFDFSIPTYVLAECVLVYMDPQDSTNLIKWLGDRLSTAAFVVYEQIKPDDPFGQQMVRNLEARGCGLRGLHATPSLLAHKKRFTNNGWSRADAWDMDTIYRRYLNPTEHARITKIEIFDEFEEWHMIQEHYCVAIGINDTLGILRDFTFKETGGPL